VTGELSGVPARARLAVAIDGRVTATAVQWRDGDVTRFSALVPPTAYARGANSLDLLVVSGSGAGRRLAALPGAQVGYRVAGGAIADGTGRRIPIADGGGGSVDSVNVGQADVRVEGKAPDADRVIAFAGTRLLAAGRPLPDSSFMLSGWTAGPTPGSPDAEIRVFAIVGGRALELAQSG
jgi:hypothetical protein